MAKTEEEIRLMFFLRRMETEYRTFLMNDLNRELDKDQTYYCHLLLNRFSIQREVIYDHEKDKWQYQEAFPEKELIAFFAEEAHWFRNTSQWYRDHGLQIRFRLSLNVLGYYLEDHFTIV